MKYLLDTNICIYLINQKPLHVTRHFREYTIGDVGVSSISVAELQYGAQKSRYSEQNQDALEQFLVPLVIVEFDAFAATVYGRIRAELESVGTPIGALDTLIAAHAFSMDVVLVTNNTREFTRVPGLRVVNWAAE